MIVHLKETDLGGSMTINFKYLKITSDTKCKSDGYGGEMRIEYGQWEWYWYLRVLPSIEFSNFDKGGLWHHYKYKYEITFRWLPYWFTIYLIKYKEEKV